ncbi:MAG: hypothetical protein OES24_02210 [Acidimicrobiia bacterium]|nr:hypothetical protein [Acidimicrobiia bacterium]
MFTSTAFATTARTTASTATVTIDRFHARYDGIDREASGRLDRAMSEMVELTLTRAFASRRLPDVFAVCIPTLAVTVDLDLDASLQASAQRWAERVATEVSEVVMSCHRSGSVPSGGGAMTVRRPESGAEIVIYRREPDAVIDLVASVASGDGNRLWAWNQTGIWPRSTLPSVDDVAVLLARRAVLAGPVLQAVSGRGPVPLSANGWRVLARAVVDALGCGPTAAAASALAAAPDGIRSPDGMPDTRSDPTLGSPGSTPLAHPTIAGIVPRAIWTDSTTEQQAALAILGLSAVAPSLVRSPHAVRAVMAATVPPPPHGPMAADGSSTAESLTSRRDVGPDSGVESSTGSGIDDHTRASTHGTDPQADPRTATAMPAGTDDTSDSPTRAGGRETTVSEHGGVLFLIHPLRELGVVDELVAAAPLDPSPALAEIVSSVTGVAADDPAVLAVTGSIPDGGEAGARRRAVRTVGRSLVDDQVARVTAYLTERLGTDDIDRIWPRPAVIDRSPGWIEVELPLDSVDVAIRAAALDLDPGFVWWLGSVVRFRYA